MRRKEIILNFRTNRLLKGSKPAVIYLAKNIGKIYNDGQADFIVTITNQQIHFQRLSLFGKKPVPAKDFQLNRSDIKSYHIRELNMVTNCLTFYTYDKKFIELRYNTKSADTFETEDNIAGIMKILKESGVKETVI